MYVSDSLTANEKNHLVTGGADTVQLAHEYGTPLYVLDEERIRRNMRMYTEALNKYYDGKGLILYANKAFCSMYTCRLANEEGFGCDVVSGGEIYTAKMAKFPMEKVYFHGNNKTEEEIRLALECGVGHIVVDNIYELRLINEMAGKFGIRQNVMFRIKPGVEAHTHEFIQTGCIDSKFGVALENGEAFEVYREASLMENVNPDGIHCHIGSQIFEVGPFVNAAEIMMNFAGDLKDKLGIKINKLNLGGGFGIMYTENDDPLSYDKYIKHVSEKVKSVAAKRGLDCPYILMEPGRSIVGDAGITLYTVGGVKDIKNVRKYVSVDGGMADNPRYILYGSEYEAVLASDVTAARTETVTIAGKCCESGDVLLKDTKMPPLNVGDIVAVLSTGAYNYSMASNYNRIPRPAAIAVKDGKSRIVIRRETYEDLIKNDIL